MSATASIVLLLAAAAFFVLPGCLLYRVEQADKKSARGDGTAPALGGVEEKRESGDGWLGNLFSGDGGGGDGGGGGSDGGG